jgi:palmitoyl-protein thioesterase
VNEQIEFVSEQIAAIPELEGGFDALGFSQGSGCLVCN